MSNWTKFGGGPSLRTSVTSVSSQVRSCILHAPVNCILAVAQGTSFTTLCRKQRTFLRTKEPMNNRFGATVFKTVRPMLSVRCLSCPVLSVTFVNCGQTVGRIKTKLGMQVGLGPGHILLGGDPAPPNFRPISVAAKWLHISRCHLVCR